MDKVPVCGFIRRLPGGSSASDSARKAADAHGVRLPPGYTFVNAFDRHRPTLYGCSGGIEQPEQPEHITREQPEQPEQHSTKGGDWVEVRYLLRWRDDTGKKRAKYLPAHCGQSLHGG